jgi:carbonic anhydrase
MKWYLTSVAALALAALGACNPATEESAAPDPAHWSYAEQAAWGGECPTGASQSPVALAGAANADLPDIIAAYGAGAGSFINNGHTLQFTPTAAGQTTIGADAYSLAQFHFHAASEHTLDGKSYPVELHFVNRNADGALAVVGVFITEGAANPAIAALLAALPAQAGEENATNPSVDPAVLLPASKSYFAYSGSLTTPPCTEGVRWNVLSTPIEASPEQIAALTAALGTTNREVQPLNTRSVSFGQ